MIIALIGVLLIILGVIVTIIDNSITRYIHALYLTKVFTLAIGILLVIISVGVSIGVHINKDVDYQNKLHEREMLEYRIDHIEDNITGNELLYNDIVEFNNYLRNIKKWAASPWTNWFWNQDIAALDYIELTD